MKISATINRLVDKQDSSVKAFASVTMDGMFAVHGLRVMETEKGRFVNMPSNSYTDRDGNKQYSDIFHAVTKSARNALNQAVLNAYDIKLQQVQATEIEVENTPDEEMADEPEPEIAMQYKGWLCILLNRQKFSEITGFCGVFMLQLKKQIYRGDTMKKTITLLAICSLLLSGCGQIDDAESKPETTTTTAVESSGDTIESTSAKEEKDTSEAATTTIKSSQTVSSASSPTGTTVTTTKKSGSSKANGNSNQVQNNNGQVNYQPAQNNPQPDNSPSNDPQSNNGAEQNNRPTDNNQNNTPSPPVTTAKPAVTNPPTATTPKPQTTVPQTEPPAPEPTEEERYMDIGRNLSHDGSDYGKAEAVYNWMTENGSGTCVNYSYQTYLVCNGIGLDCYACWTDSGIYGHVANIVNVDGIWYVLDTQAGAFLDYNYGFTEVIDINENHIADGGMISDYSYEELHE